MAPEFLREPALIPLSAIFLVIFLKYFVFKTKPRYNLPPSPPRLPIIGNLHQFSLTNPHINLRFLALKYGPIMQLQLGEIPTVIISSAKLAKEAFKTHDLALANRPQIMAARILFYNFTDIAFAPYNSYWRYVRKLCTLEVLSTRRVQSYGFIREEEVAYLVGRLAEPYPGTVNMSKMLGMYANDVLCRVAFGRDFTKGGDYDRQGFHDLLDEYQELLGGLQVGDFFPSLEQIVATVTGMKRRVDSAFKRFDALFDRIIAEHLDPNRNKDETKDLVDVLLDLHKNSSGDMPLTMENVKALILDMFAAGTDTTFITIDWAMTELIMNPEVLKKAQAEVRGVLGDRKFATESDLPQLTYMKAVIKETFRLHPPAPLLVPRESMEHITIGGYDIPPKTRVFVNVWAMGRDPETWEDPFEFKPERFVGTTIDFTGQDFELIPFGAGRRICPGATFANAGVEIALAQLLHNFDWQLPPGVTPKDLDLSEVYGISMYKKVGLEVLAKPRFT